MRSVYHAGADASNAPALTPPLDALDPTRPDFNLAIYGVRGLPTRSHSSLREDSPPAFNQNTPSYVPSPTPSLIKRSHSIILMNAPHGPTTPPSCTSLAVRRPWLRRFATP